MKRAVRVALALWLATGAGVEATAATERIVGLPCEGCEAVFEGRPVKLSGVARIAPVAEAGIPLRLDGVVRDAAGKPVPGVVIYAYQTNRAGIYPAGATSVSASARRHGTLRGWAETNARGEYAFDTIRPGGYPGTDIPEHIHLHVIEPGRCTYYIDDVVFTDDTRLTAAQRRAVSQGRGGSGVVTPAKMTVDGNGWKATRHITLGARIPGYADCGRSQ